MTGSCDFRNERSRLLRRRVQGAAEAEIVLEFCRVEPVANGCADEFGSVIPRAAAHYFPSPESGPVGFDAGEF